MSMSSHFFLYIDNRVNMKDLTVYSRYETFIKQLNQNEDIVVYNDTMNDVLMSEFIRVFGANISKPGFSKNDAILHFSKRCNVKNESRDITTLIYIPCADHYQKQFNVFVINILENRKTHNTYTSTHCQYRETVNLMCISNANVKDIMNEQISLAMKDIMNVKD